ncbi:MAG: hypothetical protein ACD_22C00069G0006 [uncultured bacterium]|nr:MAG: hypothetical protein ACD_22C00069G0006 [uncultured bacterium]
MNIQKKAKFTPHWFKYINVQRKHIWVDEKIAKEGYRIFYKNRITTSKIKVAFFLDGVFYPSTTGESYHIRNLLEEISKRKVESFLFRCYRGWENSEVYKKFGFNSVCIDPTIFYDNLDVVNYLLVTNKITSVVFDTAEVVLHQGAYFKNKSSVKIIYDVTNVDHLLSKMGGLNKKTVNAQIKDLYEADKYIDIYWVKTQNDKQQLLKLGINPEKLKYRVVGINVPTINTPKKQHLVKTIRAVYLGNMYYPPNIGALETIDKTIKECKEHGVVLSVSVIGEGDLKKLSLKYPHIKFLGECKDVIPTLRKYHLAFACPSYGSGISMKILDYMAAGLPIIANSVGVRGHSEKIRRCVLIGKNDRLYECVEKIATHPAIYNKLSSEGYRYVVDNFNIKIKINKYIEDIKKLG